jgi:chaperonin GroES
MKINPTLDRVVIKKCNFEDVYKTGIILVNAAKNDINKLIYEVVEVCPGGVVAGQEVEMVVNVGDKVVVPEYIGSEIHIDGEDYRIIKQSEILAVINDD